MMISFPAYVTGEGVAQALVQEPEELVQCLESIYRYLDTHHNEIAEFHSVAVENRACTTLRKLGVILTNFQGD